jgi:hypothetical protein
VKDRKYLYLTNEEDEKCAGLRNKRDHLVDLGIDGRIILQWVLKN